MGIKTARALDWPSNARASAEQRGVSMETIETTLNPPLYIYLDNSESVLISGNYMIHPELKELPSFSRMLLLAIYTYGIILSVCS